MLTTVLSFCLLAFASTRVNAVTQCIDNDGNAVDWWWVYKLNDGPKYAYYDSTSNLNVLTPSETQTVYHNQNSCIERTTNQMFTNRESINWIAYGDENGINGVTNYTCGHSKGILAFDRYDDSSNDFSGFWMLHSAPKFPNMSMDSYYYPSNALTYAQNFFCATINDVTQINSISKQLQYVMPWIWESNNVNSDTHSLSNWNALLQSEWLNGTSSANLTTANVNKDDSILSFTHLTRSGSENLDIFESVISPFYDKSFEWQTWQDSSSDEPIYCQPNYKYNEEDIEKVVLGNGWYVDNSDDHSKWGITDSNQNNDNIICTGDLNRASSQNKRGGGYACFVDANFYDVLKNTINEVERCSHQAH